MTLSLAPFAALPPAAPSVGIFWKIGDVLVIDRSTLAEAEPFGDFLTHAAGHYDRWMEWQGLGAAGLRRLGYPVDIVATEYEEWPRGRVVHHVPEARFILYADRRIQKKSVIATLIQAFGLNGQPVTIASDFHYQ